MFKFTKAGALFKPGAPVLYGEWHILFFNAALLPCMVVGHLLIAGVFYDNEFSG
jgi:hypothetical protein